MIKVNNCPHCNVEWQEKETIYEYFLLKYDGDKSKAKETAKAYGCTEQSPKHFSKNVIGVQVLGYYDGVAYWKCKSCNTCFDRFTFEQVNHDKYSVKN
jgi:hypothetical protein